MNLTLVIFCFNVNLISTTLLLTNTESKAFLTKKRKKGKKKTSHSATEIIKMRAISNQY